jgi:hypothetical protein
MKVRHMATAILHDPAFVIGYGRRMFAHTFRGSTWRSAFGLEEERAAFSRYRAIRQGERNYVDWPDPHPPSSDLDVQDAEARPLVPVVVRAG